MSKLLILRNYTLIVTVGTSAQERAISVSASDATAAYDAARKSGYNPVAIHSIT